MAEGEVLASPQDWLELIQPPGSTGVFGVVAVENNTLGHPRQRSQNRAENTVVR